MFTRAHTNCKRARACRAHRNLDHLAEAKDALLDAIDAPADGLVLEGGHPFPCCSHRLLDALRVIGVPQAVHYPLLERLQRQHEQSMGSQWPSTESPGFWALCVVLASTRSNTAHWFQCKPDAEDELEDACLVGVTGTAGTLSQSQWMSARR